MTAQCPGGTPQPKGGFGLTVTMGASALAAMLNNAPTKWAVPLAALIGGTAYELTTLCGSDPISLPSFDATDAAAMLTPLGNPVAALEARQKFIQILEYHAWFLFCECSAGAVTPPSYPSEPTDFPTINPPQVNFPTTDPCDSGASTTTTISSTAYQQVTPQIPLAAINATTIEFTFTRNVVGAGPHTDSDFEVVFTNADEPIHHNVVLLRNVAIPGTRTVTYAVPTLAAFVKVNVYSTATSTDTTDISWRIWCNGVPGSGGGQGCCPPDPVLQAQIEQIMAMVTLIQRQAAPFSYIYGANHTALTDDGSISVADLIGVSVEVTTLPSSYGVAVGTPEEIFDVGFVTLGTADGWTSSRRIDHEGTLMLPPAAGVFTSIGYSLRPGVVASIRELVREH